MNTCCSRITEGGFTSEQISSISLLLIIQTITCPNGEYMCRPSTHPAGAHTEASRHGPEAAEAADELHDNRSQVAERQAGLPESTAAQP